MIVIAIIGVLVAIAVPAYNDYITRTRISEGLLLLGPVKQAVAEYRHATGSFPGSNSDAGVSDTISSPYVDSVVVGSASDVTVTFSTDTGISEFNNTLVCTPTYNSDGGVVTWDCTGGSLLDKYRPATLRSGAD